ncbi:hypothetical protein PI124_g13925 [Phytophthora idaei]|nr:hypothetical protein PI125_g16638 [Phytophthora idaei]KAG3151220.1 hypothetical protein PI126_g11113 [Phytophthora idaei]KAG3241200.1 hypothetical protein PI124_g13925 [Phytophthora idaei]
MSRFLKNPGLQHWETAFLQYQKTTKDREIVYEGGNGDSSIQVYTDADSGRNIDDRRSVSGVMVMIANGPVFFKSKYQRTVALSSAEAEYMTLSL